MQLRDYKFLGTTQSFCPDCINAALHRRGRLSGRESRLLNSPLPHLITAKIINRAGRIYFRKQCQLHGEREDFVCSDAVWFDRHEFLTPGKLPVHMRVEPRHGCPFDCGLCTEHEQHCCLGIVEITSSCNLECPLCYASSAPGSAHLPYDDCCRAIDALVAAEGRPEVLQLSGGEPTIHREFLEVFKYACNQPIDIVMINTNGIRLARDRAFLEAVAEWKHRSEIYLQFDSFRDSVYNELRGESLVETKLRAIDALGAAGLRTILVCSVQAGLNDDELGDIVRFAQERPWITGVSFQPACYVGRTVLPEELERRSTFPDIIRGIAHRCSDTWRESDFTPLPCAHPNAHSLAYAYRSSSVVTPIARFINVAEHLDLLSGAITFTRARARELVEQFMSRQCCTSGGCGCNSTNLIQFGNAADISHASNSSPFSCEAQASRSQARSSPENTNFNQVAESFFSRLLAEDISPADVFRITTTSFMDAYNFDVRQAMKDCVHFVLPSGHIIPFSAYNLLYRPGLVPLPELRKTFTTESTEDTERAHERSASMST